MPLSMGVRNGDDPGRNADAVVELERAGLDVAWVAPPRSGAGHVRERIAALREVGVTHLDVRPIGPDGPRQLSTVREWLG
jgi:hypothetical protein